MNLKHTQEQCVKGKLWSLGKVTQVRLTKDGSQMIETRRREADEFLVYQSIQYSNKPCNTGTSGQQSHTR